MTTPKWFDPHVSAGTLLMLIVLIFSIGVAWSSVTERQSMVEDRLKATEELQIRMAEVMLAQQHQMDETRRVEQQLDRRLQSIDQSLQQLRDRLRALEMARD